MPYRFRQGQELLSEVECAMGPIPPAAFFNDSAFKPLRESWSAAMFAVGFSRCHEQCLVAPNDSIERMDVDFYARIGERVFDFQNVEVQREGRKRGSEYKELTGGVRSTTEYRPAAG